MNEQQEIHRHNIATEAYNLIWDKYEKGAREHQSTLSRDYNAGQLLDMAIEEATDQMVYLLTLREKLHETSR